MDIKKIIENSEVVLEEFDYLAVHKFMVEKSWSWRGEGVPDLEKIKSTAAYLMHDAIVNVSHTGKTQHNGTGGLNAYVFPDWDGVKLSFEPFYKKSY
jgi:hypothetical protein